METYFHGGSEIQAAAVAAAAAAGAAPADGIQTLLLMNPNYLSSYSDTTQHHQPQAPSMLFFNPAATTTTAVPGNNSLNIANLSHAPPTHAHHHHHHLVGIPLPGPGSNVTSTTNQETHSRSSSLHGLFPAGFQYNNLWGSIDQNSVVSVAAASETGGAHDVVSPQIEIRRPVMVSPSRQGLSLSLSSQQARAPAPFRPITNEHEIQAMTISSADDLRVAGNSPPSVSAVSNGGGGVSGMQSMILSSKYLRAAQELLDEVINVGKAIKSNLTEGAKEKMKMNKESVIGEFSSGDGPGGDTNAKHGAELSTAQRQELQMKKAKLATILDEVEQRYRQYHHQMQIVVSSFEQAAGFGAAKSYTALALQTISKQFRCLKDAISAQIRAASKSLGEEDCLADKAEGSSRLRYVDRQLRQQRVLQQLGMIQHHAWRPQRGLPERAVSVLRAWLFEHFLHPYPKDSDKHMLAKQTGLTRSQVSNWFINARVRLWKPMVEEMYMEEMKNQEKNGSDQENASNSENQEKNGSNQMNELKAIPSKQENPTKHNASPAEFSNSTISISPMRGSIQTQSSGFSLIRSSELEGIAQRSLKKQRSTTSDMQNSPSSILSMDMDLKQHGETNTEISVNLGRLTKDGYSLITSNNTTAHGGNGGFGAYTIGDLSRFNPAEQLTPRFSSGNGPVSLTLGLPHCENLSLSGTQQNYLPNQNIQLGIRRPDHIAATAGEPEFCGINVSQNSPTGTGFENLDSQNRNRFAAQLLPDFVA